MFSQLCNLPDHHEPLYWLVCLFKSCITKLHGKIGEVYQSIEPLGDSCLVLHKQRQKFLQIMNPGIINAAKA